MGWAFLLNEALVKQDVAILLKGKTLFALECLRCLNFPAGRSATRSNEIWLGEFEIQKL